RETLAVIKQLGETHTVLLSTHILSEVEAVCERVIIINSGSVSMSRTLDEIESGAVILLEVRGPSDQVAAVLKKVPGASKAVSSPAEEGASRFEIQTHEDQDVREAVSEALMEKGWPLRRLERKRRKLEDAFFDVLRERDPLKQEQHVAAGPSPQTAVTR